MCARLSHRVIEIKRKGMNITPVSPITFLRATACSFSTLNDPGYNHILSFWRQVYVSPEDFNHLPEVQVEFDETNYWIYLSSDTMTCFLCKTEGHAAQKCPQAPPQFDIDSSQTYEDDGVVLPYFKRPHPPTESPARTILNWLSSVTLLLLTSTLPLLLTSALLLTPAPPPPSPLLPQAPRFRHHS